MKNLFDNSSVSYLTMICALGLLPGAAVAQTSPDMVEEEVVVTGFASSLEKALDRKRDADALVEVVASDDLGILPDVSITDSLARLPGIATGRDRGNASTISIRGMGSRLNVATMNNREIVTSEPSRGVRYEQFPAELIDSVEVYKGPLANKVEGGIAGLVNMNIVSPLSKDERRVTVSGNMMSNNLGDDMPNSDGTGYKGSVSYIDQFSDTFGIALGLTYQDQPSLQRGIASWDYNNNPNAQGDLGSPEDVYTPDGTTEAMPWGFKTGTKQGENERVGGVAVIEWAPTDALTVKYDLFYSQFDINEQEDQFYYEGMGNWGGGNTWDIHNSAAPLAITADANGNQRVAAAGRAWGEVTAHSAMWFQANELMNTGLNFNYAGDVWDISADVSYSEASIESVWVDIELLNVGDSVDWGYDTRDGYVAIDLYENEAQGITDTDVSSADNWALGATVENWYEADDGSWYPVNEFSPATMTGDSDRVLTDSMTGITLDFSREIDMGVFQGLSFGGRMTSREKENDVVTWSQSADADHGLTDFGLTYSLGDDIHAPEQYGFKDWNLVSEQAFGGLANRDDAVRSNDDILASWLLKEDNVAVYAMLDMTGEMGDIAFDGNVGLRYVTTDSESIGFQTTFEGDLSEANIDHSYSELLPSLNMVFYVSDDAQIRLGLAKTMSRPPLVEMRPGRAINLTETPYTISQGNPTMDPFVANQFDLGYEFYWGDNSAAAVSYFLKDLSTHIGNYTDYVDYEGDSLERTQPINGDGGVIQGVELMYQQSLDMLPAPFNGLGVFANYSYVDTDVTEFTPEENPFTLGGLSEHVGSLTVWYEYNDFDARMSYNYRSDFTSINSWDPSEITLNEGEATLDASLGYAITDGLKLSLQVQNLTNEPGVSYHDNDTDRLGAYNEWGRTVLLGFSYSL